MHNTRTPIPRSRSLIGRLLAIALMAACLTGLSVSQAGADATWNNVKVATTTTGATIDFDAVTYGVVFVIVGKGPDPSAQKLQQLTLPKSANGHYTAQITGLEGDTQYSFRLA